MGNYDRTETAKRIKNRRKKDLKLNQAEVAERAGITLQTLSTYENGSVPRMDILWDLADALECEPDYLLGRIKHPKKTTSEISELIPLRRDAIEALENMKCRLDEWSDFESILVGYNILSDIIIHIEESMHGAMFNETGDSVNRDDFISNVADLLSAYESIAETESFKGTPLEMDRPYRNEQLTIRGVSSWLGSDLAEVIRKSIKTYADPKNVLTEEA